MADALELLPNIGYVSVLKVANGDNQSYAIAANESNPNNASWTNEVVGIYSVWQWDVTFVTAGEDLPLVSAVWSDGRTLPGSNDGFYTTGRAARLTCGSCEAFPIDSWSSEVETAVGLTMEVCPVRFLCTRYVVVHSIDSPGTV